MEGTIGEIRLFGGTFAPRGWANCDGALLHIQDNSALFSVLGVQYGGDGKVTFALPKLDAPPVPQGAQGSPRYIVCTMGTYPSRT